MGYIDIGNDGRPLSAPVLAAFLDEKTGLMWADKDVSANRLLWAEAMQSHICFRCAGFDDWYLPSLPELETLRDLTRSDPAADPRLGLKSAAYWSSTPLASSPGYYAWSVGFSYGAVYCYDQGLKAFVRLVRRARASQ